MQHTVKCSQIHVDLNVYLYTSFFLQIMTLFIYTQKCKQPFGFFAVVYSISQYVCPLSETIAKDIFCKHLSFQCHSPRAKNCVLVNVLSKTRKYAFE